MKTKPGLIISLLIYNCIKFSRTIKYALCRQIFPENIATVALNYNWNFWAWWERNFLTEGRCLNWTTTLFTASEGIMWWYATMTHTLKPELVTSGWYGWYRAELPPGPPAPLSTLARRCHGCLCSRSIQLPQHNLHAAPHHCQALSHTTAPP